MSLREWAAQILTGATIADKLAAPPSLFDDTDPGPALARVVAPGRPVGLPLVDPRPRARFPGPGALEEARARGEVLHFFANHELLALELMALVLLRFPDAPRAFRRGLANTMAEEQRHLSLYLGRMTTLGVELGEIPVNDFFWRCLSAVDSPLEFIAGMSLTFEQANLDYALSYRDAFAEVGDTETAALMQEVYADEVGHVRHGLRWLRRWKPPGLDEWAAHAALIQRPLTLARAKGRQLDRAGRRAAGLPEDYIDRLAVFRHSKGRPPRVFCFNPGCEEEIVRGPDADLPAAARAVQQSLELLPALLAVQDDAVLVSRPPSLAHLQRLQAAGITLPEFVVFEGDDLSAHPLRQRTLGSLQPWGWSPAVARVLAPLGASWDPAHARRAGKSLGTAALRAVLAEGQEDWVAEDWTVGTPCHTLAEVDAAVAALRAAGVADVVLKAEWGAAGRGAIRMLGGVARTGGQQRWLGRTLARQGAVVVEPWLDRVLDLSLHYDRREDGTMKSVGAIRFLTDGRGQYRGHWLGRMADGLDRETISLLYGGGGRQQRWRRLTERVGEAVGAALEGYVGPVGVDALVYRCARDGRLRIKPVVEINPRWSMGRVALALQRHVQPGTPGWFVLLRAQEAAGLEAPLEKGRGGRWCGGALRLTEGDAVVAAVVLGEAAAARIG